MAVTSLGAPVRPANPVRGLIKAIEPWYDWGKTATICRIDTVEQNLSDESTGDAYQFELQWFGLHIGIIVGRVPPKISLAEVTTRKAQIAARSLGARA